LEVTIDQTYDNEKSIEKQLHAREIYALVQETLQAEWVLDMSNRKYEAQDIWDVVIAASVERISLEMASKQFEQAPSGNDLHHLGAAATHSTYLSRLVTNVAYLRSARKFSASGACRVGPPHSNK
jgi:hypothetical protein